MNQDSKEQAVLERSPLSLRLEAIWDIDSAAEAIEFKGKRYTWGQLRSLALEVNSLLDAAGRRIALLARVAATPAAA